MNRCTLSGVVVGKPETKSFQSGVTLCALTLRVERAAKEGEAAKSDELRLEGWGAVAQRMAGLAVGARIVVDGSVKASTWTSDSGEARSRMFVGVNAVEALAEFTTTRATAPAAAPAPERGSNATEPSASAAPATVAPDPNEIPF